METIFFKITIFINTDIRIKKKVVGTFLMKILSNLYYLETFLKKSMYSCLYKVQARFNIEMKI